MKTKVAARRSWAELRVAAAGLVVLLAAGTVVVLPPSVAQAATDVVTNCSGSTSVSGSLPYEVANAGSGDVITFALSPPCATITPASTIGIAKNLTITGPGATALAVSGGGTQAVFSVSGGTVTISGLTIEDGNAGGGQGGGIQNVATLTVADSTFSNDTATFGGGIENSGTLTVTDSTLSNDTASHSGGGIESDSATMTVTSTTFSKDSTGTGSGGGLDMFDGTGTITNSTFFDDSSPSYFGGGLQDDQGNLSMGATIVAGSPSGNDCFLQLPIGTFTDLGNNLDDDGTCHLTVGSDLPSTAAGLDPSGLESNGGPTQTVALDAGSAAINHISNAPQCPATDQRGAPRNLPCDIGAYDTTWGPAVTIAITGSQTSGEGSSLTYTTDAPAGVVSGTLTCTTVDGGTAISPSLPVGYYTIDSSSCSGLSSSNQAIHAIFPSSYAGVYVVSASPAWTVSPSPNPGANASVLIGDSCASGTFCVAVGYQTAPGSEQTLIETWDGSSWSVTTSPDGGGGNVLESVSCTSATFCVAVGYDQSGSTEQTLVEKWNGSAWSVTSSPDQGGGKNFLNGVSCTSPTACVAVGYDQSTSSDTEIETWNGTSWSLTASANPSGVYNELLGVSCTSATACVAVGYDTPGSVNQTLIETLSGGSWSATSSPDPGTGDDALDGVSCTSATACIAVGSQDVSSVTRTLIETLTGGTWSVTSSPDRGSSGNTLLSVTCTGATSCEAAGNNQTASAQQALIESWNGGSWSVTTSPSPGSLLNSLNGISCTTATACQAAGDTSDGPAGSNQTLIETPSVPVVSEVSPSAGSAAGGDTVTIIGSGFTGATAVDFGATPATIDTASGDTKLTVTDPAGSAGPVDVTVTAPGGVSSVSPADQFTYTVVQTTPTTASCTPTCTTNTVSSTLNNTSVSVDGSSGNSNPDATTNLIINTTKLNCGSSKTHNYDYLTAVSTLSTTDFATGQVLTVTETIGSEPSIAGVRVCYAASATATSGSFLKNCKPSMKAPCVKSLAEVAGNVVATLLVPATDPRFWAGDGALDVTSFSPTKGPPGTTVTIKGKNLSQIRSVVIGGAEAPVSHQSTATKVVVTVPSSAAVKAGVITVTGASGEAISAKLFTVN